MEPISVTLRTYSGKAVKVTEENMEEVAEWCGGWVESRESLGPAVVYIAMPVRMSTPESLYQAFVGDWVVKVHEKFTPYKHSSFMGKFAMREIDDLAKKRERLRRMLKNSMQLHQAKDQSSLVTVDRNIEDTVNQIVKIFT